MSEETHETVHEAEDVVPSAFVLRTFLGSIAVGVILCVVAYLLLVLRENQLRPGRVFPEQDLPPPHRVADVRQDPFEVNPVHRKPGIRQEQTLELNSFGWVDKENGVVHIPIDTAMQIVAGEAR